MLAIVAGYDVLYSQPNASNFFASTTSVTAATSTTLRRLNEVVAGDLSIGISCTNLCLCSTPFSSIKTDGPIPAVVVLVVIVQTFVPAGMLVLKYSIANMVYNPLLLYSYITLIQQTRKIYISRGNVY